MSESQLDGLKVEEGKGDGVHVNLLDWSTFTEKNMDFYDVDMILAADVVRCGFLNLSCMM